MQRNHMSKSFEASNPTNLHQDDCHASAIVFGSKCRRTKELLEDNVPAEEQLENSVLAEKQPENSVPANELCLESTGKLAKENVLSFVEGNERKSGQKVCDLKQSSGSQKVDFLKINEIEEKFQKIENREKRSLRTDKKLEWQEIDGELGQRIHQISEELELKMKVIDKDLEKMSVPAEEQLENSVPVNELCLESARKRVEENLLSFVEVDEKKSGEKVYNLKQASSSQKLDFLKIDPIEHVREELDEWMTPKRIEKQLQEMDEFEEKVQKIEKHDKRMLGIGNKLDWKMQKIDGELWQQTRKIEEDLAQIELWQRTQKLHEDLEKIELWRQRTRKFDENLEQIELRRQRTQKIDENREQIELWLQRTQKIDENLEQIELWRQRTQKFDADLEQIELWRQRTQKIDINLEQIELWRQRTKKFNEDLEQMELWWQRTKKINEDLEQMELFQQRTEKFDEDLEQIELWQRTQKIDEELELKMQEIHEDLEQIMQEMGKITELIMQDIDVIFVQKLNEIDNKLELLQRNREKFIEIEQEINRNLLSQQTDKNFVLEFHDMYNKHKVVCGKDFYFIKKISERLDIICEKQFEKSLQTKKELDEQRKLINKIHNNLIQKNNEIHELEQEIKRKDGKIEKKLPSFELEQQTQNIDEKLNEKMSETNEKHQQQKQNLAKNYQLKEIDGVKITQNVQETSENQNRRVQEVNENLRLEMQVDENVVQEVQGKDENLDQKVLEVDVKLDQELQDIIEIFDPKDQYICEKNECFYSITDRLMLGTIMSLRRCIQIMQKQEKLNQTFQGIIKAKYKRIYEVLKVVEERW